MKGQIGIEFISLIAFALLVSSILIAALNEKAVNAENYREDSNAGKIARDTAYKIEYATAEPNKNLKIDIPEEYTAQVANTTVKVYGAGNSTYPINYEGQSISFESGNTYKIRKSINGVEIVS